MSKLFFRKKGFTLIELMVVVAIIGILASIVTVSLTSARIKGRDSKRVADIKILQLAMETYFTDNAIYPLTLALLVPNYLPSLPNDPSSASACIVGNESGCYAYNSFGNNTSACGTVAAPVGIIKYHLGAAMETNEVTNIQPFLQDADWAIPAPYTLCSNGGGVTGTLAPFAGKGTNNSGKCNTAAGSPDACYDVTN